MPIADRTQVRPGLTLVATYKGQDYTLFVEANAAGARIFVLPDGRHFKKPSAAASAITGTAQNGWRFWSIKGQQPVREPRVSRPKVHAPRSIGARSPIKVLKRLGVTDATPNGQISWFCSCCMRSFTFTEKKAPTECPEGHGDRAFDELEFDLVGSDWWVKRHGSKLPLEGAA